MRCRPSPRTRPWAGSRLAQASDRIGEIWLAGPDTVVDGGPWSGRTLDEVAAEAPDLLLGNASRSRLGERFPVLIKLLDTGDWLSLQVHPDDQVAIELRGPGSVGKTEAWVVLEATPDAVLVMGANASLGEAELRHAIETNAADPRVFETLAARAGQVVLVPAGTLHAIGPGVLAYEIQEPSDLTFRVYDWGRAETAERPLHRAEALAALHVERHATVVGDVANLAAEALATDYFRLEAIRLPAQRARRPAGALEVVTIVDGAAEIRGPAFEERVGARQSLVVPASVPEYELVSAEPGMVLVGSA